MTEKEPNNTASIDKDLNLQGLKSIELKDAHAMLTAVNFYGFDNIFFPEGTNEYLKQLVGRCSELVDKRDYEQVIPFIEENIPRIDLKLEFYLGVENWITFSAYQSETDYDRQVHEDIVDKAIEVIKENDNVFQNIDACRRLLGEVTGRREELLKSLFLQNEVEVFDSEEKITNYEGIDPFYLKDGLREKLLDDLAKRDRLLSKEELVDIISSIIIPYRYQREQSEGYLPPPPYNQEEINKIIFHISKKAEALSREESLIIQFHTLLLALETGNHDYFDQKVFSYYEYFEDIEKQIHIEDKVRFIELVDSLGNKYDYLVSDLARGVYEEKIGEEKRVQSKFSRVYANSFISGVDDFSSRVLPSIARNHFAQSQLLKRVYLNTPMSFSQTSMDILEKSENRESFVYDIYSRENYPADYKFSLLMSLAAKHYSLRDLDGFTKDIELVKGLYGSRGYELESSLITIYSYLYFLKEIAESRNKFAKDYWNHGLKERKKTKDLCFLGREILEEYVNNLANILGGGHSLWTIDMTLVEKSLYFEQLNPILFDINLDSANSKIKFLLKEEFNRNLSYYASYLEELEDKDEEYSSISEDMNILFQSTVSLVYFEEIKGGLFQRDSKGEIIRSLCGVPLLSKGVPRDTTTKETEEIVQKYVDFLLEIKPFKASPDLVYLQDFTSGNSLFYLVFLNPELRKCLRRGEEMDMKYYCYRLRNSYLKTKGIEYKYPSFIVEKEDGVK